MEQKYSTEEIPRFDLRTNVSISQMIDLAKQPFAKKEAEEAKKKLEVKRNEFLQTNAKKVERVVTKPAYFYHLYSECNGKYGWFDASKNIYNMEEYHTGWAFETQELYNEFLNIR